ncbi:hypothetical protein BGZ49_002221, partial [Haplosporangium sp. Z 27]
MASSSSQKYARTIDGKSNHCWEDNSLTESLQLHGQVQMQMPTVVHEAAFYPQNFAQPTPLPYMPQFTDPHTYHYDLLSFDPFNFYLTPTVNSTFPSFGNHLDQFPIDNIQAFSQLISTCSSSNSSSSDNYSMHDGNSPLAAPSCDSELEEEEEEEEQEFTPPAKKSRVRKPKEAKPQKIFPCTFAGCNKVFSRKFNLDQHDNTHKNVKSNICNQGNCTKAFIRLADLRRHIRTHSGETPFDCKFGCRESFSRTEARHRHYMKDHREMYLASADYAKKQARESRR